MADFDTLVTVTDDGSTVVVPLDDPDCSNCGEPDCEGWCDDCGGYPCDGECDCNEWTEE